MSPDSVSILLKTSVGVDNAQNRDLINLMWQRQGLSHGLGRHSVNGKTDLYVIENGTLTALKCCKEILNRFVMPYARAIGPEFILMDDKACPYRAHVTHAYL